MEIMNKLLIALLLVSYASNIFCLKLLAVFPHVFSSHYKLASELAKGLANAGHEVTMLSSRSEPSPPKNYKEIWLRELMPREDDKKKLNAFDLEDMSLSKTIFLYHVFGVTRTDQFFNHSQVQELINSNEHFDAVIMGQFWNDAVKILGWHFKAPVILLSSLVSNRWVNNVVGNPAPPSYVPDLLLSYTSEMNFFERTYNFVLGITYDLFLYLYSYPSQGEIIRKYFPNAPPFNDIQYNVSLLLINSHESIGQPVPQVPNMVNIGGFHVNPPKVLPKEFKEFMDNATNGVIYFSMGSILTPSDLPKNIVNIILKVLGSRKERVLWKWDQDNLENKPENVLIAKWFPQLDILAHPTCKLFISHGGLLSTIETIYMGVPILAIPVFGDQKLNAARAASLGYGRSVPFAQFNEHTFTQAVNEMLENPSYTENAKFRSKLFHDRPMKPMETALYWIEYIVRHKGAQHLRVAGVNLPLYKYYMLDIIGTLLVAFVLIIYLVVKTIRCIKLRLKYTMAKKKND